MTQFQEAVTIQVGVNILLGLAYWIAVSTGKFSFGHAGFMLLGAYGSSLLTLKHGWSLYAALLVGALVAAVGGALIGWVALRLSMLYLAIVTLIFAELLVRLVSRWDYAGGGTGLIGMRGTSVALVLGCVAAVIAFLILLTRSRMGLAYHAIREDPQAAMASGIRVTAVSVGAFTLSAAVTGLAGGLLAHQNLIITPELYLPHMSLLIILFAVLGGTQYFWGAIVGATVLSMVPIYFSDLADWYLVMYGAIFVVLMIVRPQGLIGSTDFSALRRWFSKSDHDQGDQSSGGGVASTAASVRANSGGVS